MEELRVQPEAGLRIPFNRVSPVGRELELLSQVLESGHLSGDGEMARRCERLLEVELGVDHARLVPSGTHALELAGLLLELRPGDEVICPSFTFSSTINAFAVRGAQPVFAEIREDTLNLDERALGELITERTAAIVCPHYGGVACELEEILATAGAAGVEVVEDNAHGLFGSYRARPLGSFGRFAALSFHETKNYTCGEGGALLLGAEDAERADVLREKGTNRVAFMRGEVDSYTWVDTGSSYLLSELQAAFLLAQLERREEIQAARHAIWERYADSLADWAEAGGVGLPTVPGDRDHPAHLFTLLMPTSAARDALLEHLGSRGIVAAFHYLPLHLSPMGRRLAPQTGRLPVTESVSARLLRLPLYRTLGESEQAEVISAVTEFDP